ncbi:MAG TPA: glycosyltransferase family 2 protein, partial [Bryobacteraceae bacterium]|nr:glycosyltransferase family 2 protein [Bryobacteraceae bacterium]
HSTDATASVVSAFSRRDSRVRLLSAPPLPAGWCGKQHACFVLAQQAKHDVLCFVDADVRLQPAALARISVQLAAGEHGLVSGFPHQETKTFFERLLLPLIHFVLLAYLPFDFMRLFPRASGFGAGCGQLMMVTRKAYEASGGHAVIRSSLHDGLKLPQAIRRSGFSTDCLDLTALASCRMYRSGMEVWQGLGKNATEGLAAPSRILPFTFLLFVGQVLPFLTGNPVAIAAALLPRIIAAIRFRQPLATALLHPLAVTLLLLIQWQALIRAIFGKPSNWKGRSYAAANEA